MAQPWAWSPLVLWYNTNHIKTPPTSINFLFDPACKQRIAFTRQQEDVIAWMGVATGAKKPYDMTKQELANAKDGLKRLMPNILKFPPQEEELVKLMADESIWITALSAGGAMRIKDAGGPGVQGLPAARGLHRLLRRRLHRKGRRTSRGGARMDAAPRAGEVPDGELPEVPPPTRLPWTAGGAEKQGKSDLAHELFYDQPEIISKMVVIGPPPNIGDYIDAFNEVAGS